MSKCRYSCPVGKGGGGGGGSCPNRLESKNQWGQEEKEGVPLGTIRGGTGRVGIGGETVSFIHKKRKSISRGWISLAS